MAIHPKMNVLISLLYAQKGQFWKKFKFNHSLVFTLNFSKHGCNGRKEVDTYFALRIIYVFAYACEACYAHSRIDFARRIEEVCNFAILSLVHDNMGHREKNIWSQEQMYGFVDRLLLDLWREKDFRKQTQVKHVVFGFLCERLGPYLKKEYTRFRNIVPTQERVAMSLHRLDNGDGLQNIIDLCGVHKRTL